MFADKIPMKLFQDMLAKAHEDATSGFAKAAATSGKTLPPETIELTSICADIAQLYFFSMAKQIDIFEATLASDQIKSGN